MAKNEPLSSQGPTYVRANRIAESLPARAWRRLSAGAKGERLYDWALTPLWRLQITAEERRFGHYLLIPRSLDEKREHAYYVVYAPRRKASRQTLVNVAGRRWEIEIGFEAAKGECGLDQYEVRRWQGWYRHITFALLAHAVLATLRVRGKKLLTALCRSASRRSARNCVGFYGVRPIRSTTSWNGPSGAEFINGGHGNLITGGAGVPRHE
nr:transposase [Burkholderia ubonensis]